VESEKLLKEFFSQKRKTWKVTGDELYNWACHSQCVINI
jgi:hypothetical protein